MQMLLLELQSPLREALSIASMENSSDASLSVPQIQALDRWINMLLKVNDKAERSLNFCPSAASLPPFPAIGLVWTALANNAMSLDLATGKNIHSLVNSITIVNVAKSKSDECVPVLLLPGIKPPQQVTLRPKGGQTKVMLSKVSIKDHPHHDEIVALAKELHAGKPWQL